MWILFYMITSWTFVYFTVRTSYARKEKHLEYNNAHYPRAFQFIKNVEELKKTIYNSWTWGYICIGINHTIFIRRRTTSAVYFMYKSGEFKTQSVKKLEKPKTEKAKSHIHSNNRCNMTSKEQGFQEEPVEYWLSRSN